MIIFGSLGAKRDNDDLEEKTKDVLDGDNTRISFSERHSLNAKTQAPITNAETLQVPKINPRRRSSVVDTMQRLPPFAPIESPEETIPTESIFKLPPQDEMKLQGIFNTSLSPSSKRNILVKINLFGRIQQIHPIEKFMGKGMSLLLNKFLLIICHESDLSVMCRGLSTAVGKGKSIFQVRWDWRAIEESLVERSNEEIPSKPLIKNDSKDGGLFEFDHEDSHAFSSATESSSPRILIKKDRSCLLTKRLDDLDHAVDTGFHDIFKPEQSLYTTMSSSATQIPILG